jgi:hypothetical protein
MRFRVRDLCRESVDFAIRERLLSEYQPSGRFLEHKGFRSSHMIGEEIKLIAHYEPLEGPLYEQREEWNKAYGLVAGFTQEEASRFDRKPWTLPRLYGPIAGILPGDVLNQLQATVVRHGFATVDMNDRSYQHQRHKPRWKQEVSLTVELRTRVFSQDLPAGAEAEFVTFVDFQISSLAAPLFLSIEKELSSLLHVKTIAKGGPQMLLRDLTTALRGEIDQLPVSGGDAWTRS